MTGKPGIISHREMRASDTVGPNKADLHLWFTDNWLKGQTGAFLLQKVSPISPQNAAVTERYQVTPAISGYFQPTGSEGEVRMVLLSAAIWQRPPLLTHREERKQPKEKYS